MRPPKASPLTAVQGFMNLAAQPSALDARTAGRIVAGSLFLGLLGDLLLYNAALGLNVPLWTGAAIGVFFLVGRPGHPLAAHQLLLLLAALLFAVMVAFRGSAALQAFDVLAVFGCLSLAAALPAGAGLRRLSLVELTVRGAGAAVAFAASVPRVALDSTWARRTGIRSRENTLVASRVVLLSAPLVAVFGGLFVAADAVFQARIEELIFVDLGDVWQHVFWFVGAGWFACGLFWLGHVVETPGDVEVEVPEARRLRSIETGVVLGSLAALFGAFVLVQVRYLFGGESIVEKTIDLTYAEYARRGFFELVAASALLLPVLLAFDWARRQDGRSSQVFRGLAAVLVLLLFVVMASAIERMRVYMDAFGLTEPRVYVMTFLLTLGVVFVWFLWTVLRGRRSEFVLGAGAAALLALLALNVSSPDALIASTNTSRLGDGRSFDAYYASMLGPEAAPILAERIDRLEAADACVVAKALLAEWSDDGDGLRSWNFGREKARDAVEEHRAELTSACPS